MSDFLTSIRKQFEYYKQLGEKTFDQVADKKLFWQANAESNSIATIVKHLHGNMLSRWTDFRTTDGEKPTRQRDGEFENDIQTREAMMRHWNEGWACLFDALDSLKAEELSDVIYIRNQGHTIMDAIGRQLAHYPYHVGQIVFIGKMVQDENWKSLSIPRGKSTEFNKEKFDQPKSTQHFTDEFLKGKSDK